MDTLSSDTIPTQAKTNVTAVSLGWTAMPTCAVTRDYRTEEEVRQVQDPENTGEIGTLNERGRLI